MRMTADIAEVTSDTGDMIGSGTTISEDRIEALAFEVATSLASLLRTRFHENDDVLITVHASIAPE